MENEHKMEPHQFKDRIIFMSMYHDVDGRERESRRCVRSCSCCFDLGVGHSVALGAKKSGLEATLGTDSGTTEMMKTCAESGHPVFRCSSSLARGDLKSNEKRWKNNYSQPRKLYKEEDRPPKMATFFLVTDRRCKHNTAPHVTISRATRFAQSSTRGPF